MMARFAPALNFSRWKEVIRHETFQLSTTNHRGFQLSYLKQSEEVIARRTVVVSRKKKLFGGNNPEDNHKLIEELRAAEDERQMRDKLEKEKQERLSWMERIKHDAYSEESARNQDDRQDHLIRQFIGQAESISEDIDCFIEEKPPVDFRNSIAFFAVFAFF